MTRRSGQSGYVVLKGKMWHGRYWQDTSEQEGRIRRSVPLGFKNEMSKSEARRKLRAFLELEGINKGCSTPGETFAQRAQWWAENKLALLSPSYRETREINLRKHLLPHFGKIPVSLITEGRAQEFIADLYTHKLAPATIETITGTLKAVLGEKICRDWNLLLPKASDREQRFFTPAEMLSIVEAARGKWKPFFALLSEAGLRFGESAGLHAEDLDLAAYKVHVKRSVYHGMEVPTKSRAGFRTIDISPEVANMLRAHLAGKTTGRVFETKSGRPLAKDNVRHSLHRILAKLKIPRGGLHSFRHGRVSLLQARGVQPELIKQWTGHSNLKVTGNYTHFENEYRQSEAQRVSIFAKEPARTEVKLPNGPNGPNFPLVEVKNDALQVAVA